MFRSKIVADPDSVLFQNYSNPELKTPKDIARSLVSLRFTHWDFHFEESQGEIICHREAVADILAFVKKAYEMRFPICTAIPVAFFDFSDRASCALNNSSGHNMRYIENSEKLSLHAIGFAFDINPMQNPCLLFDKVGTEIDRIPVLGVHDEQVPGTLHEGHELVLLMEELGWEWGGNWSTLNDHQHFQKLRRLLSPELQAYVGKE